VVEMALVLKRPADTEEAKKAVAATVAIFMVVDFAPSARESSNCRNRLWLRSECVNRQIDFPRQENRMMMMQLSLAAAALKQQAC
jgi:hypothetical protein